MYPGTLPFRTLLGKRLVVDEWDERTTTIWDDRTISDLRLTRSPLDIEEDIAAAQALAERSGPVWVRRDKTRQRLRRGRFAAEESLLRVFRLALMLATIALICVIAGGVLARIGSPQG